MLNRKISSCAREISLERRKTTSIQQHIDIFELFLPKSV